VKRKGTMGRVMPPLTIPNPNITQLNVEGMENALII
jgi:hypothetical protein